jgi:UDP-glucuronate 4-epimerase
MVYFVTGSAGFIGFHLCLNLLKKNLQVVGLDNHNDYYDIKIKADRVDILNSFKNYQHYKLDIADNDEIKKIFKNHKPQYVVNLAAQAGVRYSIENPLAYVKSNLIGFTNILESCRHNEIKHLVYASTSSIYGANLNMPFSEHSNANHPLSFYAATKKSNELMAHTYSYLYNLPTTGLRFFTVYGPWGRPDMALFKFTKAILNNEKIDVFNNGNHIRDFTYIDDIVSGIVNTIEVPAKSNKDWDGINPDPASSKAPWRVYNIGNSNPVSLMDYVYALEDSLKKKAKINYLPLQLGDVPSTYADVSNLEQNFNYKPKTSVNVGVENFVNWYKKYFNIG